MIIISEGPFTNTDGHVPAAEEVVETRHRADGSQTTYFLNHYVSYMAPDDDPDTSSGS